MTVSFLSFSNGVRQEALDGTTILDDVPELFQYPGGEWSLRKTSKYDTGEILTWAALVRGGSADDLLKASLLADYARQRRDRFVLLIPYFPAARADKGLAEARVYTSLVNLTMKASTDDLTVILDPHSEFVVGRLARAKQLELPSLVARAVGELKYDAVIAPDAGAKARANLVADYLGLDVYTAHKKRDFETGKILSIGMDKTLPNGRYLVVDDICDGGGTFLGLAEAIGKDPKDLGLWVTHGIFSGKANQLGQSYSRIYTTDSHPGHNRVGCATTIVPLLPDLMRECY